MTLAGETAPAEQQQVPTPQGGNLADWLELVERMIGTSEYLAGVAQADAGCGPQVVGLAVLARSIGHARATHLLIRAERIVEARTITRSLFENLFLAVALNEDGPATLKELEDDHHASRFRRGRLITRNTAAFSPEQIAQVGAHLEKLAKGRISKPSDLAKRTSVREAYLFYAQLSGDSAHPSLDALERHAVKNDDGQLVEFSLAPGADPDESRLTAGWACMALLGVLVAVRDLTRATEAASAINAVGSDYLRLTGQGGIEK